MCLFICSSVVLRKSTESQSVTARVILAWNTLQVTLANSNVSTHTLVWVLEGVIHDGHESQPGLLGSRDDLPGRQGKAIESGVPQLKGVRVLDTLVVGPVNGAATGLVYD